MTARWSVVIGIAIGIALALAWRMRDFASQDLVIADVRCLREDRIAP